MARSAPLLTLASLPHTQGQERSNGGHGPDHSLALDMQNRDKLNKNCPHVGTTVEDVPKRKDTSQAS